MAASNGFLELLRELHAPLGHIVIKRMFSGASLYCDSVIFALIEDDVLYLKADDNTTARFEAEGLGPFTYEGKTRPVAMSYWRTPERLLDEPDEMLEWAREAIAAARLSHTKKASSPKSKPRAVKVTARDSKSKTLVKQKRR